MKIGTMELVVILFIAFLVLGPEQTAAYTRKLGKALRTLRIYMNSITEDITDTITEPLQEIQKPLEELKKPLEELQKPLEDSLSIVRKPMDELEQAVHMNDAKLHAPLDLKQGTAGALPLSTTAEELEEAVPLQENE